MNQKNRRLINSYLPCIFIIIITVFYFLANRRMWWYGDDEYYCNNLITGIHLSSLKDIVDSQIWHYFNWGGRTVAHSLLQLLFLTTATFIDIFNVASLAILAYFSNRLLKKPSLVSFSAIYSGIIFFNVSWIETLLWQTGIANYLYMGVLQFAFIYIYYKGLESEKKKEGLNLIVIPLGLLVGWSNENMGPAIFLGVLAIIIYRFVTKKSCPVWMLTGALFNAIGSAFLILAPGNYIRSSEVSLGLSPILTIVYRFISIGNALFIYMTLPILFLILSIVIYKAVCKLKFDFFDFVLLGMSVASWGAMIMAAHYPARATFGTVLLITALAFRLLNKAVPFLGNKIQKWFTIGNVFLLVGVFYKLLSLWFYEL